MRLDRPTLLAACLLSAGLISCVTSPASSARIEYDDTPDTGWTCGGIPEGEIIPIDTASLDTTDEVFIVPEVQAAYPGGWAEMGAFIAAHLRYPEEASREIAGTVLVRVVVERDGRLSGAEILRGLAPEFDAEALRVVRLMPRWSPARIAGHRVRAYAPIRVIFRVQ